MHYSLVWYTPISKNVVGENGDWQLSNGNCTTERNCGFYVWYAETMSSSRGARLDGNKKTPNLHIWQWKTVFLHALHVHFSSFDILKTPSFCLWREMTCFAVVWTTWAYDDKCSILSCPERWFQFNSWIKWHFQMTLSLPSTSCLLKLPTDTALRTANWLRLYMTNHDSPSKVGTVWSRYHESLFPINIQYPHFLSVVQSPFDNWHSSFSPTTFFEIAVY